LSRIEPLLGWVSRLPCDRQTTDGSDPRAFRTFASGATDYETMALISRDGALQYMAFPALPTKNSEGSEKSGWFAPRQRRSNRFTKLGLCGGRL